MAGTWRAVKASVCAEERAACLGRGDAPAIGFAEHVDVETDVHSARRGLAQHRPDVDRTDVELLADDEAQPLIERHSARVGRFQERWDTEAVRLGERGRDQRRSDTLPLPVRTHSQQVKKPMRLARSSLLKRTGRSDRCR